MQVHFPDDLFDISACAIGLYSLHFHSMDQLDGRKDRLIKLTAEVACSGCAAKVGPAVLGSLLKLFTA